MPRAVFGAICILTLFTIAGCQPSAPTYQEVRQCLIEDHGLRVDPPCLMSASLEDDMEMGAYRVENGTALVDMSRRRIVKSKFLKSSKMARSCNAKVEYSSDWFNKGDVLIDTALVTLKKWSDGWRCESVESTNLRVERAYAFTFNLRNLIDGQTVSEADLLGKNAVIVFYDRMTDSVFEKTLPRRWLEESKNYYQSLSHTTKHIFIFWPENEDLARILFEGDEYPGITPLTGNSDEIKKLRNILLTTKKKSIEGLSIVNAYGNPIDFTPGTLEKTKEFFGVIHD